MSFIGDLPKGLHHLDVRAADYFGNQHLPLLPPELRILNCSATGVKNSGLFNMPKVTPTSPSFFPPTTDQWDI